jgi:hypothetical protein
MLDAANGIAMTTEELAELFLARLYELAEEAPHPNFLFSVNDFAPKLGITDRGEIQKALNYLGDRGLIILASFDMFGGISAGITIEGSIFVEKGGETGIIEHYRRSPQTSADTPLEPSPPAIDGPFFPRRAMEAILEDIEEVLKRDDAVAADIKKDLLSDLATLKIQMERTVKNREIINVVVGNLSRVPSVAPLVAGLNSILEAFLR